MGALCVFAENTAMAPRVASISLDDAFSLSKSF